MVVTFVAVVAFSLIRTVTEADRFDTERTRAMIASAVDAQVREAVTVAEDNAIWDDEATAAYSTRGKFQYFKSGWGLFSSGSSKYDTVLILDRSARPLAGFLRGRPARIDPAQEFGPSFAKLVEQASRQKRGAGGIAPSAEGPMLIGLANIVPTTGKLDSPNANSWPYWLVMARPFDQATADRIGDALLLEDLKLSDRPAGETSLAIRDPDGKPLAGLTWTPTAPAITALGRVLPWIAFVTLLHLAMGVYVGRNALRSVARLADEALVDSLSALPNRRALRKELDRRLERGERLALALIDLDGFKGINDNYGHHVGDRLIKSIASLLSELVGTKGMVARLGGDEFAILVTGGSAVSDLQDVARAMLDKLSRPFRIDERTVLVGASIGLASVSLNDFDSSELMRRADVAMYSAKRAGKMRLAWYDEMLDQKQAIARTVELELRQAIESEDFEIAYQPVVDIHDKKIVAVEALLRWKSPTRGEVSPAEFIPVAEETGLIDRMGMIVLRRACQDGLGWGEVRLAVNVSAAQLRNPEFARELRRVLDETAFPAARLDLEITEAFLVYDSDSARKVLEDIRAIGVGVALEDYGTGFGSIGFLRLFSFSKVKLDRSLVSEAGMSAEARTVIQAKIAIARALNVAVVAEGVETEDQADMMRVAGCDQLQGWLFSRPITAEEVGARLAKDYPERLASRLLAI